MLIGEQFRGVVAAYARDESKSGASGGVIPGFDAAVWGDVPLGGGLSSSAALEMATATFLDGILDVNTTKKEKALRCQWAEHEFASTCHIPQSSVLDPRGLTSVCRCRVVCVDMPCGIMDQYISAHAESGRAVLLDCRSLEVRPVKLDNPSVTVLITSTIHPSSHHHRMAPHPHLMSLLLWCCGIDCCRLECETCIDGW